jgi:N-methylhydantoinase B
LVAAAEAAAYDAVSLEIAWSRLQAIVDEGETTLIRTAFSPIIREAFDFGVLLLDLVGGAVVQSQRSLPSFVSTLPRTLAAALEIFPHEVWNDGDVYATNDPWLGTGHLPDITMLRPIFRHSQVVGYMGVIAHWADIGGAIWSSDTTELFEEGLQLPLRRLVDRGELNPDLAAVIAANVRLPEQVMGDLHAQLATLEVGIRRFQELLDELALDDPAPLFQVIQARTENVMRAGIRVLPDGVYHHELEIDGVSEPLMLRVAVGIEGDSVTIDWTGSSPQCDRGINETYNHAYAMSIYPFKCLLAPDIPNNEGACRPIRVHAPEGTIINARRPAPVGSRQMLGHYISLVVMAALGDVLPRDVLADSGSPNPRVVFTGMDANGRKYGAALLLAGGVGAQSWRDGLSAVPFPSNPAAISVEMIESATPLLFRRRELIANSGGDGCFRGGLGTATEVELRGTLPGVISVMCDRVHHAPSGFAGGGAGRPNVVTQNGQAINPKGRTTLVPGDVVSIESAGGGGYGDPQQRDATLRARDVDFGYVIDAPLKQ